MKNLSLLFAVVVLAFWTTACMDSSGSEVDMEAVQSEIEAMEAAYEEAANANDVDAIMAYYADDAHSMPAGKPTLKGEEAIRAHLSEDDGDEGTIAFETWDVWAAGNYAVETGGWTYTNDKGAFTGKYMSLFEKRDGKYVCIRDIWNSDQPMMDDDEDENEEEDTMGGDEAEMEGDDEAEM